MKKDLTSLFVVCFILVFIISCKYVTYSENKPQKKYIVKTNVTHPDWSESAVIYKVDLAKHTPEGTIKAFIEDLPRLHAMGIEILWLSSIFTSEVTGGNVGNTGTCSVKDYMNISPQLGTKDDLEDLVKEAHSIDMYIILDWQANYISSNSSLVQQHPDWFSNETQLTARSKSDTVFSLHPNYNKQELRQYMLDAMKYWVEELDVDGFLCDEAGMIPCNFWNEVRTELDELKPVFMIAEDEDHSCLLANAFDMNCGYKLSHILEGIATGGMKVKDLKAYFTKSDSIYEPAIYKMNFAGRDVKNIGDSSGLKKNGGAAEVLTLLTFTVPGMALINEETETGASLRLDSLKFGTGTWENDKWTKLFKHFMKLKKGHAVFWNGTSGGSFEIIDIKTAKHVFAFLREGDDEKALVLLNLSGKSVKFKLREKNLEGNFFNYFTSNSFDLQGQIELQPFGYLVLLEEF